MRRCLGCNALIPSGSRCAACQAAYRVPSAWSAAVKGRDGFCCTVPNCPTPFDRVQAHHRTPRSEGGTSTLTNGATLCHTHHREAHRGR